MRNILILFFVSLLCSCKNAHVIDINTFDFPEASPVYIGQGPTNDIIVPGLSDTAVRIQYTNGSFYWTMLKPCYLWVNAESPNKIMLDTIKEISIRGISYKISDIKNVISHYTEKKCPDYINIANVIRKIDKSFALTQDSIRTVICPKHKRNCIVLLDTIVHVTTNNITNRGICTTGNSPEQIKLSFFHVINSIMVADVPDDTKSFHDSMMFYFTYVKPLFTSFGASEITFSTSLKEKKILANFDIFYRAVISKNVWYAQKGAFTGIPISVSQQTNMNFMANDLYLPHFSEKFAPVLGEINTSGEFKLNDALKNKARDYEVSPKHFIWKGALLVLLAGIYIVLFSLYYKNKGLNEIDFNTERGNKKFYFPTILLVLTVLLLIKMYIGYNLSFTYPYFITYWPASAAIAPLILTAVFAGWICINEIMSDKKNIGIKMLIVAIVLFLAGVYSYFQFYLKSLHFPGQFPDILHGWSAPIPASIYILMIFIGSLILSTLLSYYIRNKYVPAIPLAIFFIALIVIGCTKKSSGSIASLVVCSMVIILACWQPKKPVNNWKIFSLALSPIVWVILCGSAYIFSDVGYLIDSIAFLPLLLPVLFKFKTLILANKWDLKRSKARLFVATLVFAGVLILAYSFILYKYNSYDPSASAINTDRTGQRATVFFNFDKFASYGIRETEGKAQFFAVMSKYTLPHDHDDFTPIHHAISGFTDPIVRNDLSFPFGFIYSFSKYWLIPLVIIGLLWLILAWQVLSQSLGTKNKDGNYFFTTFMYLRIFALSLLLSSGIYLVCSYYGLVPFTGRLIYGLGQDSFAEVIETTLIFIIFGIIPKAYPIE